MMNNETMVSSIKQLCKDNNMTVAQLEKEVGMSQGLVSKWKDKVPSLDKIIDIADYFHVSLDEVVGRNQKYTDENYDFINLIIEQTKNSQLQWFDKFSKEYCNLDFKHPNDENVIIVNFKDEPDWRRYIDNFVAECNDGFLIFNSTLVMNNNAIEKGEFFFYIQPNKKSKPVYQKASQEQLFELYKAIKFSVEGMTPEMEAEEFKLLTMYPYLNDISDMSLREVWDSATDDVLYNKNLQSVLRKINTKETKKLLTYFSNPKTVESIKQVLELIEKYNQQ